MQLTLADVSKLFDVTENSVIRWINDTNLPAEVIDGEYRFHRAELLEWATINKRTLSPAIYEQFNGDSIQSVSLADAVRTGGVIADVAGEDARGILRHAVEGLPIPASFGTETLLDLILARKAAERRAVAVS